MSGAGMTILTGLVVVFAVLILLTFIFYLFGKVAHRPSKASDGAGSPAPAPETATVSVPKAVPPAPMVEDGISDEVVAVIAAATLPMRDMTSTTSRPYSSPSRKSRPATVREDDRRRSFSMRAISCGMAQTIPYFIAFPLSVNFVQGILSVPFSRGRRGF